MNLLLVDDEIVSIQGLMSGVNWERCGIDQVFTACSARDARVIFGIESIDMALLDIEMPEENGIEFLAWIRQQDKGKDIPCAFLTCHAEFNYAREAIHLGCADYILKPVDYEKVEALVNSMALNLEKRSKESRMAQYGEQWFREKVDTVKEHQKAPQNSEAIVENTVKYIMAHLACRLSVEELAFQVHLNPDYLNRIFKKYRNVSLNKFIIKERMTLAMELLLEEELAASAVAESVGYENYANFVNMFKKVHGILPSQVNADKKV